MNIIPLALTEPIYPGQYQSCPSGGVKIHHYEAGLGFLTNPLVRMLSGAVLTIEALSIKAVVGRPATNMVRCCVV